MRHDVPGHVTTYYASNVHSSSLSYPKLQVEPIHPPQRWESRVPIVLPSYPVCYHKTCPCGDEHYDEVFVVRVPSEDIKGL